MNVQEYLQSNNKTTYMAGYFQDVDFWCMQETNNLESAKLLIQSEKKLFPTIKRKYVVVKKTISYSLEDECDI